MPVESLPSVESSTAKVALNGWFSQTGQLGAVGVIATLLLFVVCGGGFAVYSLIGSQLQRAHEDRSAERAAEREERRFERDQIASESRSVREVLGRVTMTLDRIDRAQAEQATRLAELARIFERLKLRENESPQSHHSSRRFSPRVLRASSNTDAPSSARVRTLPGIITRLALLTSISTFTPPEQPPNRNDVVLPVSPAKVVDPPPPPADPSSIKIAVGRFAWAYTVRDVPVTYFVDGEAIAKLDVVAGTPFAGVKYDEPPNARPKSQSTPPNAKGKACVLLGATPGTAKVQVWANPGEGKDPELLTSLTITVIEPIVEPKKPETKPEVKPTPVIPSAESKLLPKFRDVYSRLGDADKAQLVTIAAAGMDLAAITVMDPRYVDAGAIQSAVAAIGKKLLDNTDRLKPFNPAIAEALLAAFPIDATTQTPLTPEIRKRLRAIYLDAAAAYRALAGES